MDRKLMMVMNPALERWTRKDDKSLDELLGLEDENGLPLGDGRDHQMLPPDHFRIIDIMSDFDDLSTIATDTGADETLPPPPDETQYHTACTPEKLNKISFDDEPNGNDNDGDGDTLPETPPKYCRTYHESSRSYEIEFDRRWSIRFSRLLTVAGILGSILLGAIAIMSLTLHQLRDEDTGGSSNNNANQRTPLSPPITGDTEDFDFSPIDGDLGLGLVPDPDTEPPMVANNPAQLRTWLVEQLITAVPSDDTTSLGNSLKDTATVQHAVLEWMVNDPSLQLYSTERLVQRFSLGVVYWSVALPSSSSTPDTRTVVSGGWMTYSDECQWPLSRNTRRLCTGDDNDNGNDDNDGGIVTQLFLEEQGLNGTLASELGLLTELELVFLASNAIQGSLPTHLGRLTNLERWHVPRNQLTGTIPTEFGKLTELGVLGLGGNALTGTLPTQLSAMTRLGALHVQRNQLTGSIPEGLADLSRLAELHLEHNQFEGSFPEGFGNSTSLTQLALQGNTNLTGAIPDSVCQLESLEQATVDCDRMTCRCCEGCEDSPAIVVDIDVQDAIENENATTTDGDTDTNDTSTTTTLAPGPCRAIVTARDCYGPGESVDFDIWNCEVSPTLDVLALYNIKNFDEFGFRNALFWVPSCRNPRCAAVIMDDFLFRDDGTQESLDFVSWPLDRGDYKFVLIQLTQPGSVTVLTESPSFRIDERCFLAPPS